jgi:nucleoid-associated protein YgaU
MKKPILTFSAIAAVAATALATTLYLKQPVDLKLRVEPAKSEAAPDDVKKVEAAPVAEKTTEVALAPAQPATPPAADVVVIEPQTADTTPSFDTVRVEQNGDAVIAGRAEPDADVTLKWNGNVVGAAKANGQGSFVLIPEKPLMKGSGALTLEMSKNGSVVTSEGSVIVDVKENAPALVAKIDPVAPTQVIQSGAARDQPKDVQLTAVDYDASGNIVFSGKAVAGSVVRFYVDDVAAGEGLADVTGNWSFKGTSLVAPGTHRLRADAVDVAGKVVSRIELPFLREDAATVAAAQVAVAAPATPAPVSRSVVVEVPAPKSATTPEPAPEAKVATAPEPVVVVEGPKKLVIQPGNSLWKLSREVYGKGRMFTIIYEANRDQLKNPNKIFPGQILTAPKQN